MDEPVENLPAIDPPPRSGRWAEEHPEATGTEVTLGNTLGAIIDPDDDEDNGGYR